MAKVIKKFTVGGSGRKEFYPWHEWLDGRVWELEMGKDFKLDLTQFRNSAYQAAKRNGLKVKVYRQGNIVQLQARPIEANGQVG